MKCASQKAPSLPDTFLKYLVEALPSSSVPCMHGHTNAHPIGKVRPMCYINLCSSSLCQMSKMMHSSPSVEYIIAKSFQSSRCQDCFPFSSYQNPKMFLLELTPANMKNVMMNNTLSPVFSQRPACICILMFVGNLHNNITVTCCPIRYTTGFYKT